MAMHIYPQPQPDVTLLLPRIALHVRLPCICIQMYELAETERDQKQIA
jgi:hypothetical protein